MTISIKYDLGKVVYFIEKKLIEEKLHEVQEAHPNEVFHVLDCHI